ncbi:MAG: phasin family protein [Flavobacteriales bacterium]
MEKDIIKNLMYMAVGYASMNRERIEEFAKELTDKGKMTEEEGKKMIQELIDRSKQVKEDIENKIENVSKEIYNSLHIATKDEMEEIRKRLSAIEEKLK